jgi:hypothetical protein
MLFGNGQTTTTNVVIPAGATSVQVTYTPINDSLVEGDEFLTLSVGNTLTYDAGSSGSALFVLRDNDVTAAPVVLSSVYDFNASLPEVRFVFNQNVSNSIAGSDFQIVGPGGLPSRTFSYNSVTNTATLRFSGPLPDGDFVARAIAAGISNASGQVMAADSYLNFFALAGDADRNRTVDFNDLLILAQNYNQTGRNFGQGNFDYSTDATVGFNDLLLLAQRYNTSILTAASGSPAKERDRAYVIE